MLQVTRKDNKEALENMIRRFNRKVQQSGVLAHSKSVQRFEKPISKTERRKKQSSVSNDELIKLITLDSASAKHSFLFERILRLHKTDV